jgi:hypothetical protein
MEFNDDSASPSKRFLEFEAELTGSTPSAQFQMNAPAFLQYAAAREGASDLFNVHTKVNQLHARLPSVETQCIEDILEAQGGNFGHAVEVLRGFAPEIKVEHSAQFTKKQSRPITSSCHVTDVSDLTCSMTANTFEAENTAHARPARCQSDIVPEHALYALDSQLKAQQFPDADTGFDDVLCAPHCDALAD